MKNIVRILWVGGSDSFYFYWGAGERVQGTGATKEDGGEETQRHQNA